MTAPRTADPPAETAAGPTARHRAAELTVELTAEPTAGSAAPGAVATGPTPLGALLAAAPPPPTGVRPDDVGAVAWQVLVHDGALRPLWGDLAASTGSSASPALRAAAVRALVPPRAVLGRAGAVWVHADGAAPERFDVLVERRVRRPSPHPARVPHECPLPPGDVVRLGDVRVTSVARTALDLARWLDVAEAAPLLRRLVVHAGLDPGAAEHLAQGCPDRRRLGPRLRALLDAQECLAGTPAALEPVIR